MVTTISCAEARCDSRQRGDRCSCAHALVGRGARPAASTRRSRIRRRSDRRDCAERAPRSRFTSCAIAAVGVANPLGQPRERQRLAYPDAAGAGHRRELGRTVPSPPNSAGALIPPTSSMSVSRRSDRTQPGSRCRPSSSRLARSAAAPIVPPLWMKTSPVPSSRSRMKPSPPKQPACVEPLGELDVDVDPLPAREESSRAGAVESRCSSAPSSDLAGALRRAGRRGSPSPRCSGRSVRNRSFRPPGNLRLRPPRSAAPHAGVHFGCRRPVGHGAGLGADLAAGAVSETTTASHVVVPMISCVIMGGDYNGGARRERGRRILEGAETEDTGGNLRRRRERRRRSTEATEITGGTEKQQTNGRRIARSRETVSAAAKRPVTMKTRAARIRAG